MKAIGRFIRTVLILAVIVIGGAIAYAFSGHYDVSVGSGHTAVTNWYLETVRHRSIERRTAELEVPDLTDPEMIEAGALAYDESCSGCHGRPGRDPSDSFDPQPPALTRGQPDPAEVFWVTRHGIKMSAMPARGEDRMSDEVIWTIAAFLQTASSLTEGEYREMIEPEEELEPEPAPEEDAATEEAADEAESEGEGEDTEADEGNSDDEETEDEQDNDPDSESDGLA